MCFQGQPPILYTYPRLRIINITVPLDSLELSPPYVRVFCVVSPDNWNHCNIFITFFWNESKIEGCMFETILDVSLKYDFTQSFALFNIKPIQGTISVSRSSTKPINRDRDISTCKGQLGMNVI